ncbi:MAG: DUF1611 domain-containing protein [Chloroflexota bacterium]|nr:DUF1611 domain-containing protein [Chloroflexota bacterium]
MFPQLLQMSASPRRLLILAEGTLDFHHGKTTTALLRYRPDEVVAVVDSAHAGQTTDQVLGLAGETPIVGRVDEAFALEPTALLIGIAPRGGALPDSWRRQILTCLAHGMHVISGLHFMLNEDQDFVQAATQYGVTLTDVRTPPLDLRVADMRSRRAGARVVTFVGSDCAVGKMTAALEVAAAARRLGLSTAFVATGQTGIMLEGAGVAMDRVIGDFMAGAVETLVVEACEEADWVFVEGQGSLLHPGYSGVTLALLHGSLPDAMILVHPPSQQYIEEYPLKIPSLRRLIQVYEEAAGWVKPAPVVGVALNTRALDRAETECVITEAERETGLSCTDPVKCGGEKLVKALLAAFQASAH